MTNDTESRALAAISAARDVQEAAWSKLGSAMALAKVQGTDTTELQRLRASASQRVTFYNRLFHEIQVTHHAVSAPSTQEIKQVQGLVAKVQGIATSDALLRAGLNTISGALDQSADLANSVDTTTRA